MQIGQGNQGYFKGEQGECVNPNNEKRYHPRVPEAQPLHLSPLYLLKDISCSTI